MKALRMVYSFRQKEFTQKFLERTKRGGYFDYIKLKINGGTDRVFAGTLTGDRFYLFTVPDMIGPWDKTPPIVWKGFSVYASPTCIYGTVKECDGFTIVDYHIGKLRLQRLIAFFGLAMLFIFYIFDLFFGLQGGMKWDFNVVLDCLTDVLSDLIFLYIIFAILYQPSSERAALQQFMEDLEN